MISYEAGTWGIGFIFSSHGSVFPKALCWAVPNAMLAAVLHDMLPDHHLGSIDLGMRGVGAIWGSFVMVLSFLIVFRNNQAYSRFNHGAGELDEVTGLWVHAAGDIISFCTKKPEKQEEVRRFQHLMARLMSMLFCASLQGAGEMENDRLDVLDYASVDQNALDYMRSLSPKERVELISQWVNRLVHDANAAGVLQVPPPILARAYTELHQGKIAVTAGLQLLKDVPFPFPYAQMISTLLLIQWITTPLMASQVIVAKFWCVLACFVVILVHWSLFYIALQIDNPIGDDHNDLPVAGIMEKFNNSLVLLLQPQTQKAPSFKLSSNSGQVPNQVLSWSSRPSSLSAAPEQPKETAPLLGKSEP